MAKTKTTTADLTNPAIKPLTSFEPYRTLHERVGTLKTMHRQALDRVGELRDQVANAPLREKERASALLTSPTLSGLPAAFDVVAAKAEAERLTADAALYKQAIEKGEAELRALAATLAPEAAANLISELAALEREMAAAASTLAAGFAKLLQAAHEAKAAGVPVAAVLGVEPAQVRPPVVGARPTSLIELAGLADELVVSGKVRSAAA